MPKIAELKNNISHTNIHGLQSKWPEPNEIKMENMSFKLFDFNWYQIHPPARQTHPRVLYLEQKYGTETLKSLIRHVERKTSFDEFDKKITLIHRQTDG